MSNNIIELQPLGGVGQIGSNMFFVKTKNQSIIIDAGILFPNEDFFNIKYLIPDLSSLDQQHSPIDLIITHGHEDHIGAIIHLLEKFPDIKISAPPFAAAIIRRKFKEAKIRKKIFEYPESHVFKYDDITISPIHVNHSIPQTYALFIKDNKNRFCVFFASDFKCDFKNIYEKEIDLNKLKKLSTGINHRIMCVDSTNIESVNKTLSEVDIVDDIDKIIKRVNGRIFVTLFSSNIYRIQTLINIASKYKLNVIPYGRSMISYIEEAKNLDILKDKDKRLIFAKSIDSSKVDNKAIVLLSGCQGDFKSTLRRVATGDDSLFVPKKGDTLIFSSKAIPGNEKKITNIRNMISEFGCEIVNSEEYQVHASGHPGQEDLEIIYNEFNPTDVIPIHGESYFLNKHIELIKSKYSTIKGHLLYNYDTFCLKEDLKNYIIEGKKLQPIIIHGDNIPLARETISKRRKMASSGVVFISINVKHCMAFEYDLVGLPDLSKQQQDHFDKFIKDYLFAINKKKLETEQQKFRIAIRHFFDNIIGYKPVTIVHCVIAR